MFPDKMTVLSDKTYWIGENPDPQIKNNADIGKEKIKHLLKVRFDKGMNHGFFLWTLKKKNVLRYFHTVKVWCSQHPTSCFMMKRQNFSLDVPVFPQPVLSVFSQKYVTSQNASQQPLHKGHYHFNKKGTNSFADPYKHL